MLLEEGNVGVMEWLRWRASCGDSAQVLYEWFQGLPGAGEILRQGLPRDQQDSNPEGSWMVGRKVEC